jgi:hypothetical protein
VPQAPCALEARGGLRKRDVKERILRHLALPIGPSALGHPDTIAYDVTGERAFPAARPGLRGS